MRWRRRSIVFFHPNRALTAIVGVAIEKAASHGTDSLDLLTAAVDHRDVAKLLKRLGADPVEIATAALGARSFRHPAPGLTDDATRVMEAISNRALELQRDPGPSDLLVGLATADTQARGVLDGLGIEGSRVRALLD